MYKVAAGVSERFGVTYAEAISARSTLSRCGDVPWDSSLFRSTNRRVDFDQQLARLCSEREQSRSKSVVPYFPLTRLERMYVDITSPASIQLALNGYQGLIDKKWRLPLCGRVVFASSMDEPLQNLSPHILTTVISVMTGGALGLPTVKFSTLQDVSVQAEDRLASAPHTLGELKNVLLDKRYESVFYAMMAYLVKGLVEKDKLHVVQAIVRAHPELAPHVMANVVASPKWQPYAEGCDAKTCQAQLEFLKFMEPHLSWDPGWDSFFKGLRRVTFAEGPAQVLGPQAPQLPEPSRGSDVPAEATVTVTRLAPTRLKPRRPVAPTASGHLPSPDPFARSSSVTTSLRPDPFARSSSVTTSLRPDPFARTLDPVTPARSVGAQFNRGLLLPPLDTATLGHLPPRVDPSRPHASASVPAAMVSPSEVGVRLEPRVAGDGQANPTSTHKSQSGVCAVM